ncbi:MAG: DinB family protein [Candidatus Tectomicrobia bacterium]|uniref:DinB family protein n=1 Tax=Tectimicrobiota bacterium TaxID=2528274 RepID=A0A933GPB5_UNCTE|nr:DinB family protein [Candidatus Tectomicrobia bacterium]
MSTMEYFRSAAKGFHKDLTESIKDLSNEQLHFRPLEKGSHISFILWHNVRTEDLVINFLLQKKTPVWNTEGWDKKFGLDPKAQGTGMTAEQAAAVRITDLPGFLQYMGNVFKATDAYLEGIKDEDLSQVSDYPMLGKRSLYQVIGGTVLSHGSSHLGEIWYVKGLQGLKGSPI